MMLPAIPNRICDWQAIKEVMAMKQMTKQMTEQNEENKIIKNYINNN
jgi:hypothetical protein